VVALFDIHGLEAIVDGEGRSAGDALLRVVAQAIADTLRAYDVTIRWDADEFVCLLSDLTVDVAVTRVRSIQSALDRRRPGAKISVGLAELEDADTPDTLVTRASVALYRSRAERTA
jgi:diguanylate cyclase